MAAFTRDLQEQNAPNYLSYSRGYDRVGADSSLGKLFSGLGNIVDSASRGFYQGIREDIINPAVDAAMKPLLDQTGGNLTPDQTIPIAGTGARGAHYAAVAGTGIPVDIAQGQATLPPGAENDLTGLERMKAAYQAGELSSSHFDASVLAAASKLRAQYPAWTDEIDARVAHVTGVQGANSLRQSILTDMNSMAAASNSTNNKMLSLYVEQQKYWGQMYTDPQGRPNLTFDQFKQNFDQIQLGVAGIKANEASTEQSLQRYKLSAATDGNHQLLAERAGTSYASGLLRTKFGAAMQMIEEKASALAAQGQNANAADVQNLDNQATALHQQIVSNFTAWAQTNIPDLDPTKLKGIIDNTITLPIQTIHTNLGNKDTYGAAMAAARISKNLGDQTKMWMEQHYPALRALGGIRSIGGDMVAQGAYRTLQSEILPPVVKDLKAQAFGTLMSNDPNAPAPKASQIIKDQVEHGASSGKQVRDTLTQIQLLATSKDPIRAGKAIDALYDDPDLWQGLSRGESRQLYSLLGSPEFTAKVAVLAKTNPEAAQKYYSWMEKNWYAVAKESVDTAQGNIAQMNAAAAAGSKIMDWHYDPQNFQFVENTPAPPGYPSRGIVQTPFASINQSLAQLRPVLEAKYGSQAQEKALEMIQGFVHFNPPAPGSFIDVIKKAIPAWSPDQGSTVPRMNEATPPGKQSFYDLNKTGLTLEEVTNKRTAGLNPEFRTGLESAINDYTNETGNKVSIDSLVRTRQEQAAAYARYQAGGGLAAPPGHSLHEVGEAADLNTDPKFAAWLKAGRAAKYGLEFLPGHAGKIDPNHIQLSRALRTAKANP